MAADNMSVSISADEAYPSDEDFERKATANHNRTKESQKQASLHAGDHESKAFQETSELLRSPPTFLAPIPSVVSLQNIAEDTPILGELQSLLRPILGPRYLTQALDELKGYEKMEMELQYLNPLTSKMTSVVTGTPYSSSRIAVSSLEELCKGVPRRVCQHPFKRNDIVWVCRTCQADETCVLCHACFTASNHEGHDVAFYHAQAGGCCDCGDPDAWDPQGFCPHHGPASSAATDDSQNGPLDSGMIRRVQGIVPAIMDWMVSTVAETAQKGHTRAHRPSVPAIPTAPSNASDSSVEATVAAAAADAHGRFDPSAASSSKKNRSGKFSFSLPLTSSKDTSDNNNNNNNNNNNVSIGAEMSEGERLGRLGRAGGGLYLVLYSDDIHSSSQYSEALYQLLGNSTLFSANSILKSIVTALRKYGQLVVWGTMELVSECGVDQARLWMDGFDAQAASRVGNIMLEKADILSKNHKLHCSILTLDELKSEQRAVATLQWLICLARSCDPLCQKVAESIRPEQHLVPLLLADFKLNSRITKHWHSLLLTLLAVPTFKSHLAEAYCDTYQMVTSEYAKGMGVLERSGYALSVQFLNRVTYVVDLVQGRDLLGKLGRSLLQTLQESTLEVPSPSAALLAGARQQQTSDNAMVAGSSRRLNPSHFVLAHRRYSPCISDLKCVLNVKGMPRLFASQSGSFLKDWIASLALGQLMDPQVWRDFTQAHVSQEVREWVGAFNASISLGSLFERLLAWDDSDPSPIQDPNSTLSRNLMPCADLTLHVITTGLVPWQQREMMHYQPNAHSPSMEGYKRKSASLPFSTVAASKGTATAYRAMPISQVTPFSFHLPLHRFVAACLREVCLRSDGAQDLMDKITSNLDVVQTDRMFTGLMEFPLLVLSCSAQVRASLWRRNGPGLNDQVLNYAEPPFCRSMRDADLLLSQFAVLGRSLHQGESRPSSDVGISFFVHLLLHRLGVFEFAGFVMAPQLNRSKYMKEAEMGWFDLEVKANAATETPLPTTYSTARDPASSLLLLEEFLHIMIIFMVELPPTPPSTKDMHIAQAKSRLRREVVHRLASGHKTHSELAEVHHVLSHWDNMLLSEEGKTVNPDDATGAALEAVLADVADRKSSRGKMQPDKWRLREHVWDYYDPNFFHISLRAHQTAAENRPDPTKNKKAVAEKPLFGIPAKPLAPRPIDSHVTFVRLRRDVPCDATMMAIAYRIIHMHCRDVKKSKNASGFPGAVAYESPDRSETALARTVHLLTLGAFAWQDATSTDTEWRSKGGGSAGSIFADFSVGSPTAKEWVEAALLSNPAELMADPYYEGEETTLQLLQRLAKDGGVVGSFVAQDNVVRSGAAWVCEFAVNHSPRAREVLGTDQTMETAGGASSKSKESDIERRKRIAKQKAMQRVKAQAAKFASMMGTELGNDSDAMVDSDPKTPSTPGTPIRSRQGSFGSAQSFASSQQSGSDGDKGTPMSQLLSPDASVGTKEDTMTPPRLLKCRPQCIICNDDPNAEVRTRDTEEFSHRKSRRRRNEGSNALAFVGYIQASTILKGGGGPPPSSDFYSQLNPVRRFVGTHVTLCGHAVHSECWESYLASVSHREDRIITKRDEFRCPFCQRLSNCLVPFIDVGVAWLDSTVCHPITEMQTSSEHSNEDANVKQITGQKLHDFLVTTPWWVSKHIQSATWDGHSAFVNSGIDQILHDDMLTPPMQLEETRTDGLKRGGSLAMSRRRSVRSLRKKDLYAAWNAMMKTPRFMKRRMRSRDSAGGGTSGAAGGQEAQVSRRSGSSDTSGETLVWRRFMDQVSDISYRADGKRLGDENLHNDFGEFRHYIVEKYTFNMANRFAGKEPTDWPSCVFSTPLSDNQRQELSREKLLSKLLMSIQAFTYSSVCELREAQRLLKPAIDATSNDVARTPKSDETIESLYSKFGIAETLYNGQLIIMKEPSAEEDDGYQPFNGRLGKIRYLGLAVTAAAGAVAADLVQLVMQFPVGKGMTFAPGSSVRHHRSPITFPILYGHVLTHIVAALCASCGRARARSDSLEVVWPVPFSRRGSFVSDHRVSKEPTDSVAEDCEGFLQLGWVARTLQILLGKIEMSGLNNVPRVDIVPFVIKTLGKIRTKQEQTPASGSHVVNTWILACLTLLQTALQADERAAHATDVPDNEHVENAIVERFHEGWKVAAAAGCSFLSDFGIIVQILLPGVVRRFGQNQQHMSSTTNPDCGDKNLDCLEKLRVFFGLDTMTDMLQSDTVREIVSNWYKVSIEHLKMSTLPSEIISGTGTVVNSRLFRTQGYRVFDWPMESCKPFVDDDTKPSKRGNEKMDTPVDDKPQDGDAVPMEIDPIQSSSGSSPGDQLAKFQRPSLGLVTLTSKKCVPLLGGYTAESMDSSHAKPRISMMPTSYTDLYAELGQLLPESEQTAVCLVCGEVLNAGGHGECTQHSYKCGAGAGVFFLLQECSGLIMHNSKAAYIYSPYVDSHGETPQYRGRPLNLDLDRYGHFHEVWSGHTVRQMVLAERASSRQIILQDFY